MEEVVLIEVVDAAGKVLQRVRVDQFPVTIGRAYSNDIILDDQYVSPHHLRILQVDNMLIAEDCESLNGVHLLKPPRPLVREALPANAELRMGETYLRLRRANDSVADTVAHLEGIPLHRVGLPLIRKYWAQFAILAFGLLLVSGETYFGDNERPAFVRLATTAATIFAVALIAAISSILGYVKQRRSQYMAHLILVVFWAGAALLLQYVIEYYSFAFAAVRSAEVIRWVVGALVVVGYFYTDSRLSDGPLRSVRATLIETVAVAGLMVGAFFILSRSFAEFYSSGMDIPGELKPPSFRVVGSKPIDQFLTDLERLQPEIDALATQVDWYGSDE